MWCWAWTGPDWWAPTARPITAALTLLFLSQVPGMTVLCPASFAELRTMLRQAVLERTGPVAVRYPRGGEGAYQEDRSDEAIACCGRGRISPS